MLLHNVYSCRRSVTLKGDTRLSYSPPVASAMLDRVTSTLLLDNELTPPIPGNRSNTVNSRWSQRNGSFVSSLPSVTESNGRVSCREGEGEGGGGEEGEVRKEKGEKEGEGGRGEEEEGKGEKEGEGGRGKRKRGR